MSMIGKPEKLGHKLGGFSVEQFKSQVGNLRGFAASNLFVVSLPTIGLERDVGNPRMGNTYDNEVLNILCNATEIPGRNIDTSTRQHGVVGHHMANGRSVAEMTLNFHLTNDYYVRNYFEEWQNSIIQNEPPYNANYYKNYAKSIKIYQLRRGESFPIISEDLGFDLDLPPEIKNRLPEVSPVEILSGLGLGGIDIGDISSGKLNVALMSTENIVYEVELIEAFPAAISPISLNNDADGLSQMSVVLAYSNWISNDQLTGGKKTFGDIVGDTISDVIGAVVGAIGY